MRFDASEGRRVRLRTLRGDVGTFRVAELTARTLGLVADGAPQVPLGASVHVDVRWPEGRFTPAATVVGVHGKHFDLAFVDPAVTWGEVHAATVPLPAQCLGATFARPFVFGERMAADLERIGSRFLVLRSHDRSLVCVPSLPLALRIDGRTLRGTVLFAHHDQHGVAIVVALAPLARRDARWLVEHLLLHTDTTPARLRDAGLPTRAIRRAIACRDVVTSEAYVEVLRLRHLTYVAAKKLPADASLGAAASEADGAGRVLGFYHRDRLVASVSLRFPDRDTPVESVERAMGVAYPRGLPPKDAILEVIKLCIHPDYRRSDLMVGICEQICRVLLTTDRTWFLAAADRWLAPRYAFVGYRKTPHHYFRTHAGYRLERSGPDDERIDVLVSRPFRFGTFGLHGGPLRWNFFLRDVTSYALGSGALRWNALQHLVRLLYTSFRPWAALIERIFVK